MNYKLPMINQNQSKISNYYFIKNVSLHDYSKMTLLEHRHSTLASPLSPAASKGTKTSVVCTKAL